MDEMMTLREGTLLHNGAYRIERVLGQGGFGITYLAVHVRLKKRVAIKEFFPKSFCDRDADTSQVRTASKANSVTVEKLRNKFVKEAEHIAEMDSPYIVRIIDVFEENHTAYYIMDYIEGRSLSEIVRKEGPLPVGQAVDYITKIGDALTYIHSKRMNHLDVKPANIMVRSKDNTPILIDFGLSKQYDSEGNQTSTTPVGISHGYAPMEQYNDGGVKEFSPQTDLYSLAATLYFLLSGVVPPQATRLADEELTFPAQIPQWLQPIIRQAMSSKRAHRHPSIAEFIKKLEARQDADVTTFDTTTYEEAPREVDTHVAPREEVPQVTAPHEETHHTKKSKTGLYIACTVILCLIVGAGIYLGTNISRDPMEMALKAKEREDYEEAVKWYRKAAEQGHPDAQEMLGEMYYKGQGVPQNYTEVAKWFRMAADHGYPKAQYNLGVLYQNGQGVPQDYTEAAKWYRKAADQGYADAQRCLGYGYNNGQGVTQDYTEAAKWYRKAADQGDDVAQFNLGLKYYYGQGVTQDYTEAVKWWKKAADQGFADAQYNLGYIYDNGQGVTQDYAEAVKWYRNAADQGYAAAQLYLGILYYDGHGVPKDYAEAAKWFRKSADQDHTEAQTMLGAMYYDGKGVPQDLAEAKKWWEKAAAQGQKDAIDNLKNYF